MSRKKFKFRIFLINGLEEKYSRKNGNPYKCFPFIKNIISFKNAQFILFRNGVCLWKNGKLEIIFARKRRHKI